jgi:hypothetical protein
LRCRSALFAPQRAPTAPAWAVAGDITGHLGSAVGSRQGHELFALMRANDLEGIVAKRLADPYDSRVGWFKIKNPDYLQKEGRRELLNRRR